MMQRYNPLVRAFGVLACTLTVAATAAGEPQFTASGVTCDYSNASANSFSFTELSASVDGANATRLAKLRRLNSYYEALQPICKAERLPGCAQLEAWRTTRKMPWPTLPDVDYLAKRARLLQGDDQMLVEATRILQHRTCENVVKSLPDWCVKLAAAEEKDPQVKAEVDKALALMPQVTAPATPEKRAVAFYSRRPIWGGACSEDSSAAAEAETPECKAAALKTAEPGEGGAKPAEAKPAEAKPAEGEAAECKVAEAKAAECKADAAKPDATKPDAAKVAECKAAAAKAAKCKAAEDKFAAEAKAPAGKPSKADLAVQATVRAVCAQPKPAACFPWAAASADVGRAAAAAPAAIPDGASWTPPQPGTEEAALIYNAMACRNATFYVSPTRELVRHSLDNQVTNQITVCVDTTGFAVDQPIQLLVTTPSARRVYGLWPGEPLVVPFETTFGEPQVAHLKISGYPRREVLRAIAGNATGPLDSQSGQEAFDLLAKANKVLTESDSKDPSTDELDALAQSLASSPTVSSALYELYVALDDKAKVGNLPTLSDAAFNAMHDVVSTDKGYINDSVLPKLVDPLLPVAKPNVKHQLSVAMLAKSPADATNIAKTLTGFIGAIEALVASRKDAAKSNGSSKEALTKAAATLCRLTAEVLPLVSEDVLVNGCSGATCRRDRAPYLIQYDYSGGFQRASMLRPVRDDDRIFVEVQNVPPGWSIGASLGERTAVQRSSALVGLAQTDTTSFSFSERTSQSVPGFKTLRPLDLQVQGPSTQIIALGSLSGTARYTFQVCASSAATDDCTAASSPSPADGAATPAAKTDTSPKTDTSTKTDTSPKTDRSTKTDASVSQTPLHRVIALNTLTVHSIKKLGLRAGFGVSLAADLNNRDRDLVSIPGSLAKGVRQRNGETDISVPLLFAYYPSGRDATELPTSSQPGIVAGVDVLHAFSMPRLYLGGVYDFGGIGLTLGISYGKVSTVDNAVNTLVAPTDVQNDTVWLPGAFLSATTDFDVFQAAFMKYFTPAPFPGVAASSDASKP